MIWRQPPAAAANRLVERPDDETGPKNDGAAASVRNREGGKIGKNKRKNRKKWGKIGKKVSETHSH